MTWKIAHPTPKGLLLLGDIMNQFILWRKQDIVLTASSLTLTNAHLERVVEDGEVFLLARDHHTPEMPHSSLIPSEQVPHTPQPSLGRIEQGHDDMPHISFSSS
jgi:hypothetical protein